jgi:hypothetical protein
LLILLSSVFLNGCDSKQPSNSLPAQTTSKQYEKATTLHGAVSDDNGFATHGTVTATHLDGEVIGSTTLQESKNYSLEIPANTRLPLLLTFSSADKEKAETDFVAVVIHPAITKYDINPLTTAIAKKAMTLGGYTDTNLRQAAETVSSMSDNAKATAGAHGNPTQRYGGWH